MRKSEMNVLSKITNHGDSPSQAAISYSGRKKKYCLNFS